MVRIAGNNFWLAQIPRCAQMQAIKLRRGTVLETIQQFISGEYQPHGYCLLWQPALVWTHVISDTLIAAAYFSIPLALIRFVNRRPDVSFGWMIWLFALFILACGTTHVMGVWNLWHGNYGVEAI